MALVRLNGSCLCPPASERTPPNSMHERKDWFRVPAPRSSEGDLARIAKRLNLDQSIGRRGIVGLGVHGKVRVRERILMPAIDPDILWKRRNALHVRVHLLRRSFEQPAAAHREHRVADEDHPLVFEIVSDVAGGMRRDVPDHGFRAADTDPVAFGDDAVDLAHPLGFGRRGDGAAGGVLDCRIAAGMIGMPMGVEHLGQPPSVRAATASSTGSATDGSTAAVSPLRNRGSARRNCR